MLLLLASRKRMSPVDIYVALGSFKAKLSLLLLLNKSILGSCSFDRIHCCSHSNRSCSTHRMIMCHCRCTVNMMMMVVVVVILEVHIPSRVLLLVPNRIIVRLIEIIRRLVSSPSRRWIMMSRMVRMVVIVSRIDRVITVMIVQVIVLVMELRLLVLLLRIRLRVRMRGNFRSIQHMRICVLIVVIRSSGRLVIKLHGSLIVKLVQHLVVGLGINKVRMFSRHSLELLLLRMVLVLVAMQWRMVIKRQRSVQMIVIVAVIRKWTRTAIHLVVELDFVLSVVLIRRELIVNSYRLVPIAIRPLMSLMMLLIVPGGQSIQTHRIHGQSRFAVVVSETVQGRHIVNRSCGRGNLRRGRCSQYVR